MGAATEHYLQLRDRLNAAHYGARQGIIAEAAKLFRVSVPTIYRKLQECGWTSGRKPRADRGKSCVPHDLAVKAAGMVETARRANGKKTLPITTACKILQENGHGCKVNYGTGEVTMPSPSTISRIMYREGCHPDQVKKGKAAQQLRSLHPNWCWQVDASVCVVFYLPGGEVQVFDEKKYYKNKPAALAKVEPERVIRWVVTDHYSGAFYLRYSQGAEDAKNLLAALVEAMCRRGDDENDCLYGVPFILLADKGSAGRSAPAQSLFTALGIKFITHAPGNPRAKGQVEQCQNLVETQFEGRLRMYRAATLSELNSLADTWRIAYNLTEIHSRHDKTRHSMWRTITEDQLRIPASPDILYDLAYANPETTKVPHNLVLRRSLKGWGRQEYALHHLPGIMAGMEITLRVNTFRAPCMDVMLTDAGGIERTYTLEPLEIDNAGFCSAAPVIGEQIRALPDTATDEALKEIQKQAYGTETLQAAEKARNDNKRAYPGLDPMADVKAVPMRTYMPKRGRELTLAPQLREAAPLSLVEAAMQLSAKFEAAGMPWAADDFVILKSMYPTETVPAADIGKIMDTLLATHADNKRSSLQLVAGGAA